MGNFLRFPQVKCKGLLSRDVELWWPSGYSPAQCSQLLWMHDGQNLFHDSLSFAGQAWRVQEAIFQLMQEGILQATLVVGIFNTHRRLQEYLPNGIFNQSGLRARFRAVAQYAGWPQGDAYLRLIFQELKPMLEKKFGHKWLPQHTFMMGSSMGGLISIAAILHKHQLLGGMASLSTHYPTLAKIRSGHLDYNVVRWFKTHFNPAFKQKLYFDLGTGTRDGMYEMVQNQIDRLLLEQHYPVELWQSQRFPGADHNEWSWRARLKTPLKFLLS